MELAKNDKRLYYSDNHAQDWVDAVLRGAFFM